jgi:di/tripeptidase
VLDATPTQLFAGGRWVDADGNKTLDVDDPATGTVIATVADGVRALDAAVAAQETWVTGGNFGSCCGGEEGADRGHRVLAPVEVGAGVAVAGDVTGEDGEGDQSQ